MKILKKLVSITLVISLILLYNSVLIYANSTTSKIDDSLYEKIETSGETTFDVAVWIKDIDTEEIKESAVRAVCEEKEIAYAKNKSLSEYKDEAFDYKSFIRKVRDTSKQEHLKENTSFVNKYLEDDVVTYISKFTPVVYAKLSAERIAELSKKSVVEKIYEYSENEIYVPEVFNNNVTGQLEDETRTNQYTGDGIYVGVFDSCLPRESVIDGYNIIDTLGTVGPEGNHAENTMNVLLQYAPDANYYLAGGDLSATGVAPDLVHIATLEWMVENYVYVLSMGITIGSDSSVNTYGNISGAIDYITYNDYIIVTTPVGNLGQHPGVGSSAMSYNSIAVGAILDSTSGMTIKNVYYPGSTLSSRPDLCAIEGDTSTSTPHVTGTIIQMVEADESLLCHPEVIKAILTSGVRSTTPYGQMSYRFVPSFRTESYVSYMQVGAGVISSANAFEAITNENYYMDYSSSGAYTKTIQIQVSEANKRVRISLAYNMPITKSGTTYNISTIERMSLQVYHPTTNALIASSSVDNYALQIVDFTAPVAGTYNVVISKVNTNTGINQYGVAWHIY